MKRFVSFLFLFINIAMAMSQRLNVESFTIAPQDLTASTQRRNDANGQACALIKVQLARPGAEFLGNVMGDTPYNKSEYFVYMMKGSKMLQVKLEGYLPVMIDFEKDWGIAGVEPLTTYVLSITLPNVVGQSIDDGKTYFSISVTPKNASVRVDNELVALDDGQWLDKLDRGVHSYKIEAAGYESIEKTFSLGTERMNVDEVLVSTMATLTVKCPTAGVDIYINEKKYSSNSTWTGTLVPRSYVIEARKEGYYTHQQSVELSAKQSRTIELPALVARVGQLDVAYKPLNSEVWIDGKKVGLSPDVFKNVNVGNHRVEIRKEGYRSETKTVTISEGEIAKVSGSLTSNTTATTSSIDATSAATNPNSSTTSDNNKVYTVIDEEPTFPGGVQALMTFISQNLKYPAEAATKGIQGRVTLTFIIEKDGSISNIEELNSPSPELTKEAIRVMKMSPTWSPGKKDGETVRVKYMLPITFRLN